jgi:hypothetical protein
VCDSSMAVVAEAELSGAPQGCAARLILDLGYASTEAVAVARDLARGVLTQVDALLADPATTLSAELRGSLAGLAGALSEQIGGRATVTGLDTPLARAWRAHPAGQPRVSLASAPLDRPPPRTVVRCDHRQRNRDPVVRISNQRPKLIGFYCPVCGFVLPAEGSRPMIAPLCAGSKAATGRQHAPTAVRPLVR